MMMVFLVVPAWLSFVVMQRSLHVPYSFTPLYGPYLMFIMLAGSSFTLSNMAVGILLPKWITFLHIFIFVFCASVFYTCLYLYRFPLTSWMHKVTAMFIPGCGEYGFHIMHLIAVTYAHNDELKNIDHIY